MAILIFNKYESVAPEFQRHAQGPRGRVLAATPRGLSCNACFAMLLQPTLSLCTDSTCTSRANPFIAYDPMPLAEFLPIYRDLLEQVQFFICEEEGQRCGMAQIHWGTRVAQLTGVSKAAGGQASMSYSFRDMVLSGTTIVTLGETVTLSKINGTALTLSLAEATK